MRHGFLVSMSAIAAFGIGGLLYTSEPSTWFHAVNDYFSPDPVLVVIVGSSELVDSVRAVISPDRIIADTGDAFALVDRRIIAASADAASGPINQLGWIDDPFDLVAMSNDRGRQWEQNRNTPRSSRNNRAISDEEREKAAQIAELMRKPTLTSTEAAQLLMHMDATGQF